MGESVFEVLVIALLVVLMLTVVWTATAAAEQRSVIESKLDWVLSQQADHNTRISILENNWLNYDEHPSQRKRTT